MAYGSNYGSNYGQTIQGTADTIIIGGVTLQGLADTKIVAVAARSMAITLTLPQATMPTLEQVSLKNIN